MLMIDRQRVLQSCCDHRNNNIRWAPGKRPKLASRVRRLSRLKDTEVSSPTRSQLLRDGREGCGDGGGGGGRDGGRRSRGDTVILILLHAIPSVVRLDGGEDALPIRVLHAHHVLHVQQWSDASHLPVTTHYNYSGAMPAIFL